MILNVKSAEYRSGYKIYLTFNNGESVPVDLEETLLDEKRRVFIPLRDLTYFQTFKIGLNTITWDNGADFAPDFLLELGKLQESKRIKYA